ncbi:MAG TPA: DUF2130 domain-containing protein [Hyphomicrobiaceae bacterium]|nr:DUF2130 domain-containing protein [Hyphomicrobiaceae bacterium]
MCEQPIAQDLARRIELRQQEQQRASLAQARAEAEAKVEQRIAAALAEANTAAEAAMLSKLADFQAKLVLAEQARVSAQKEIAALKTAQDAAIELRVEERATTLKEERDAAVLAERTRAFEEAQALRQKLEDLTRKLEGKSAHELGEGSEIDLFEELRDAFQADRIQRVPKGVNGADVIHEVVHNGRVCGKIIYDAKNRDSWQNGFATKLKADKLAQAADHAILSSNKFPKDKSQVHTQDGVIVANPARVLVIAEILREQIVRMHELRASKEAREEKTVALYAFVTSDHFKLLVEQVEAQAGKMLELDNKEQEAHRRVWDQRGKLIRTIQKARADLTFEVDRIIGTAGNGPQA